MQSIIAILSFEGFLTFKLMRMQSPRNIYLDVLIVVVLWPSLVLSQGPMLMGLPMSMSMPPPTEPCSCEVECCMFPWEMRRQSHIFHMPMVMRLDCCGCSDCPVTLNPAAPLPPQPRPIIHIELPEPPEPPEPPEFEAPEPVEIELPEADGKKR